MHLELQRRRKIRFLIVCRVSFHFQLEIGPPACLSKKWFLWWVVNTEEIRAVSSRPLESTGAMNSIFDSSSGCFVSSFSSGSIRKNQFEWGWLDREGGDLYVDSFVSWLLAILPPILLPFLHLPSISL